MAEKYASKVRFNQVYSDSDSSSSDTYYNHLKEKCFLSEQDLNGKPEKVLQKLKSPLTEDVLNLYNDLCGSDSIENENLDRKDGFLKKLSNEGTNLPITSFGAFRGVRLSQFSEISLALPSNPVDLDSPSKKNVAAINFTNKMKRKRLTKEEREQLEEEKQREKMRKKETNEQLKRMQPGSCMEFVTVYVDDRLMDHKFGNEVLRSVLEYGSSQVIRKQKIPCSITWATKTVVNGVEIYKDEAPVLLLRTAEQFSTSIKDETLFEDLKTWQNHSPNSKFTLAIFGLEAYLSSQNKQEKRRFRASVRGTLTKGKKPLINFYYNRSDLDDAMADLQLLHECPTRTVDSIKDVGSLVYQFTKAIAETPYKLDKQKQAVDGLGWLATCDLKDCVRVDKAGNGLSQLWLQQLMQFNNSGLDVAQAIVQQYPTPLALYKAYCRCDKKNGEELLKDILIRRAMGEAAAKRKIGPELSKKIFHFFTSFDGDFPLSQE